MIFRLKIKYLSSNVFSTRFTIVVVLFVFILPYVYGCFSHLYVCVIFACQELEESSRGR